MKDIQVSKIQSYLNEFISKRGWEKFHTPKNLSMALSVEVAELLELFQWMDGDTSARVSEDAETYERVKEEMADILCYLIQLAQNLEIDLEDAFWEKMKKTARKHALRAHASEEPN